MHRADAAVSEFRAKIRADLRSHVARGGELAASVVDDLTTELERVSREIIRTLRG